MSGVDMFAAGAWDDRALVQGWNSQVKEYNKYHALKRMGKKVPLSSLLTAQEIFDLEDLGSKEELAEMGIDLSDVEKLGKSKEENSGTDRQADPSRSVDTSMNDATPANVPSEETDAAERQLIQEQQHQQQQANQHRPYASSAAPQAPPIPAPVFAAAPGQDDALRNMNMAWFYAGYYQAQYEAQQRSAWQTG